MIVFEEANIVIKFNKKDQADMNKFATFQNMDNVAMAINEFYALLSSDEKSAQEMCDEVNDPEIKTINYPNIIKQKYLEVMEKYGVKPQ